MLYADKDGKHVVQKARVVCVACNSIESAAAFAQLGLVDLSARDWPIHPGQVGKNYMRHTTGSVYAIFNKPVHMYRGTVMAGIITDEAELNTKRGFAGGFEMETISLGLAVRGRVPGPGSLGTRLYAACSSSIPTWPGCGSSAKTCRRRPTR